MKKILNYIIHPRKILIYLMNKNWFDWLDDKKYLQIKYKLIMRKKLNLEDPQTFNEKLQWLKLYDRNPKYIKMVDKYEAKKYVASIIGEEYIIPTLGVWDKFEDIDFAKLPNQFVLKPTHTSGNIYICKEKSEIDYKQLKKNVNKWLKRKYYYLHREWPYKNVKPRIIVEEYMEDDEEKDIKDYKFFCFNGIPQIMYISDMSHTEEQRICFFDMNYKKINIERKDYKNFKQMPKKIMNFEKMKELSKRLSADIPHVRVDWYEINGKLYFGELTFYSCSGYMPIEPNEWDLKLGKMVELPRKE